MASLGGEVGVSREAGDDGSWMSVPLRRPGGDPRERCDAAVIGHGRTDGGRRRG